MRKTAILLALACAFARADYGPGTTDSDLLRSGTPVVTNAWLAVSNDTARLVSRVAGDASRITDGTNTIDAARSVWQSYSGRVCTNENEAWVYVVTGQTFTASQMADLFGGGDATYSRTLKWDDGSFINWQGEIIEFEGWYVMDGSGAAPVGYDYSTGVIPDYATDRFLAEVSYYAEPVIKAFRGTFESGTNYVGRLALTNDIPHAVDADLTPATNWANQVGARVASDATNYTDSVSAILVRESTNAAIAVADAKISTNNAAFVAAVTNCPVVIASGGGGGDGFPAGDWSDYGTLGALLAAIVAAITWLKNNQRYALHTVTLTNGAGTLLDRAGNRVEVSGDTTLTLPALEHAGRLRDFLVRLEISGSTVPTITFQGRGSEAPNGADEITYETDGDEFPVPDEAGDWLYSFTESCVAHKFAVSLKKVNTVAQGGA